MDRFRIPTGEIERRKRRLRERYGAEGYDGMVVFDHLNVQYVTNFHHIPTVRPVAAIDDGSETHLVLPKIERNHVEGRGDFLYDEVHYYYEYPQSDPYGLIAEVCRELGIAEGRVAVDRAGPGHPYHEGPTFPDAFPGTVDVRRYVEELRRRKSETELDLFREGATWVELAHRLMQDGIEPGRYPLSICQEAQAEANERLMDAIGHRYVPTRWEPPVQATFVAGERTLYGHNPDQITRVEEGDVIVSYVRANVDNYFVGKLERCMIVGPPSDEQRHYFELMVEAQDRLFELVEPGVPYAAVEETVDEFFEEHGVKEHQHHRPGHGMGLSWYELPVLDRGLEGTFSEGEVFSIEPAIYIPDVGGFRHNDTVVVTGDGIERLTYYPRDLESLTIPIR